MRDIFEAVFNPKFETKVHFFISGLPNNLKVLKFS